MSLTEDLARFIEDAGQKQALFPYLYAARAPFDPKKSAVYYSGPYWTDEEPRAAIECLLTGKWLSTGEHVHRFENAFSRMHDFTASVMVNSGSSANLVMISALKKHLGWADGDEVIVSVVGFPTTVSPLMQNNLVPVFVDITMDDLNFDLSLIEARITPRTRAILVSPVLGNPPDFDVLTDLCARHGLTFVLDGCDSLGSRWQDKHLSDYAFATSCSFYPAHHITTGEGGMVSSRDEKLIDLARSFAWWGRDCYCVGSANLLPEGTCKNRFSKWLNHYDGVMDHKFVFTNVGYNLKPLDLQGAIGLVQLGKLDEIHAKRRVAKDRLAALVQARIPGVRVPGELPDACTSWFGVPIICDDNTLKTQLVRHLESNRVQTRNYFAGNILLHPAYAHLDDQSRYPNANLVLDRVFFIGCHPSYDDAVFDYVDDVLSKFVLRPAD